MSGFVEVGFKAGECLFRAGDPADKLYILQRGRVELRDGASGQPFAELKDGASFGEQAVLAGGVRSATAIAIEDLVCLELTADGLQKLLAREHDLARTVFEALLMQLYMHNRLRNLR